MSEVVDWRRGDELATKAESTLALGNFAEAIALYDHAEALVRDPDRCAGGRWMAHMLCGDFEAAWRESDAIRRRSAPDPHRFWQGEPFAGRRVMLRSLHGFGDAVQMFRFLPRLRQQAASLIVEVPPRFVELAHGFEGADEIITWGPDAPVTQPSWDVQMEIMELPYVLRVTADDLVPTHGYLRIGEAERTIVAGLVRRSVAPRVGVVWAAGGWNPTRSIPFEIFADLLAVRCVEFWSLQGESERPSAKAQRLRDVYEAGDGLTWLAAVIERMELVITVDTVAAHLAGTLGVPCWLLLQSDADWRWMSAPRTTTPWYPTLQLWRQKRGEGWPPLIARVKHALGELIKHSKGEQGDDTQRSFARVGRV